MPPHTSLSVRATVRSATVAAALALAGGCASGPADEAGSQGSQPNTAAASPTGTRQTSPGHEHGGSGDGQGTQSTQSTRPSDAPDVTVAATVEGDQVDPPPRRVTVDQGETVRLEITSDSHAHVHVHGYDREGEASPSQPAVITFTADQAGVFEVETHDPALQVVQLQVE